MQAEQLVQHTAEEGRVHPARRPASTCPGPPSPARRARACRSVVGTLDCSPTTHPGAGWREPWTDPRVAWKLTGASSSWSAPGSSSEALVGGSRCDKGRQCSSGPHRQARRTRHRMTMLPEARSGRRRGQHTQVTHLQARRRRADWCTWGHWKASRPPAGEVASWGCPATARHPSRNHQAATPQCHGKRPLSVAAW